MGFIQAVEFVLNGHIDDPLDLYPVDPLAAISPVGRGPGSL